MNCVHTEAFFHPNPQKPVTADLKKQQNCNRKGGDEKLTCFCVFQRQPAERGGAEQGAQEMQRRAQPQGQVAGMGRPAHHNAEAEPLQRGV